MSMVETLTLMIGAANLVVVLIGLMIKLVEITKK